MSVTASVIVTQIRALSDVDEATSTVLDEIILREVDAAHEYYYGILVESDEGYFETVVTSSVTAGSRDLNPAVTTTFWNIDLVERVDGNENVPVFPIIKKEKYKYESKTGNTAVNNQLRFYIEGNAIQLVPAPTQSATDAIETTIVPEPAILNSATAVTDTPRRFASAITYRAISVLDLRLRDGRNAEDVLSQIESRLIKTTEGRQRQGPRRIIIEDEELLEYDGVYLGS